MSKEKINDEIFFLIIVGNMNFMISKKMLHSYIIIIQENYGYIDKTGSLVTPYKLNQYEFFVEDLVLINKKSTYMDRYGNIVIKRIKK